MSLYQPILFKRLHSSIWEKGWLKINTEGESVLEKDKKTIVEQIHEYESNWF